MVSRRITAVLSASAVALLLLTGAKGCGTQDEVDPSASATPFSEPVGAAVPPQIHGDDIDPNDDDFFKPANPPEGAPEGIVTYEVRAQLYNAQLESIGGLATAYVNATAIDPRVVGGVGPGGEGVWPYNKEAVRLPFQLPIFIQPGIVVSVGSTFNAFADAGEILACWLVAPNTGVISGTRVQTQSSVNGSLLSVSCFGNIG